jgi:hypothetical protein
MKLEEYIKKVLENSPRYSEVYFEINLDSNLNVVAYNTGLKITFTVCPAKEL